VQEAHIFQWRSLKTRVTIFTLAIFLVSLWSLAFYAGRMLRQDMQRLLGEQQFSTVTFVAATLEDELKDRLQALEQGAGSVDARLLDRPAALQQFLEQRTILQVLFNAGVVALTPAGRALAAVPVSSATPDVDHWTREVIAATLKEGPVDDQRAGHRRATQATRFRHAGTDSRPAWPGDRGPARADQPREPQFSGPDHG
jgi:hypothetical protein